MSTKIVQQEFGGPETLRPVEVDAPTGADLGPDEVLVRVAYAGVNTIDAMTRDGGGMAAAGVVGLPFTPGWDLAGRVEAVGAHVGDLAVGDRVFGLARFPREAGGYAQHAVVPAHDLVVTPERLGDDAAAALPMAAMTAWQAFTDSTRVEKGQRVLVTGAGGGVGHLAVQIAHHLGAHVVALASSAKHAWLHELGADETVDYRDADALEALAREPVDVALNLARGALEPALATVRRGGTLVALGVGAEDVRPAAEAAGVQLLVTHVRPERSWLESVAALAADGALVPTVAQVVDLAEAADAHRAIAAGHTQGKIVLRC